MDIFQSRTRCDMATLIMQLKANAMDAYRELNNPSAIPLDYQGRIDDCLAEIDALITQMGSDDLFTAEDIAAAQEQKQSLLTQLGN